jgi:hypothetical protein
VPRSLTDFALDLYRDEERVKWILHYAHLPVEEERVALALEEGGDGPYIVVTREGKFVTALAAGMSPKDLTVLTRSQIDTFSARVDDARRRFELAEEVAAPGKRPVDMLGLLTHRPWGLSREEFAAIAAWVPIMNLRFLVEIFKAVPAMERFRETYLGTPAKVFRNHERTRDALESMWNLSHGIAARYVLATMGDLAWTARFTSQWNEDYGPTWYATDERIFAVAVRGAWAAGRIGKGLLPNYKRLFAKPGNVSVRFDAALATTAIGLRHSHAREDARRIVASLVASEEAWSLDWGTHVVAWSDRAFDDPEGALDEVASWGRKLLMAHRSRFAEGSPFLFETEDDIPRDLALLVVVNQTFDSLHPFTFYVLPWVAKLASPEELYCPEELERALRQPQRAERMAEVYERQNKGTASVPVARATPKLGRNDPCACGSGKKLKKCCGQ